MSWQDHWEEGAAHERAQFETASVAQLLEQVTLGDYGRYHQVWDVIARRAHLATAGWVLFEVLGRDIDYLHRMPCAEALLRLMDSDRFQPVDLGGTHDCTQDNLRVLRRHLEERLGPRPI